MCVNGAGERNLRRRARIGMATHGFARLSVGSWLTDQQPGAGTPPAAAPLQYTVQTISTGTGTPYSIQDTALIRAVIESAAVKESALCAWSAETPDLRQR